MEPEPKIPVRPDPTRKIPNNPRQSSGDSGAFGVMTFILAAIVVLVCAWSLIRNNQRGLRVYEERQIGGVTCIYNVTDDKIEDCVGPLEDSEVSEAFQSVLEAHSEGSRGLQNIPFSAILSA